MFARKYDEKERLFEIFGQVNKFCFCIELKTAVLLFAIIQILLGVVYFFYGMIITVVVFRRDLKYYSQYTGNYFQGFYNMFMGLLCVVMGFVGIQGRNSNNRKRAKWYLYLWYLFWAIYMISGLLTILIFVVTKHTFSFSEFSFVKRYRHRGLILMGLCFTYAIAVLFYTYCLLVVFSYFQKYFVEDSSGLPLPQVHNQIPNQPYYQFGNQQGFQQNQYPKIGQHQQYGQQPQNMQNAYRPISDESQQRYYGQAKH